MACVNTDENLRVGPFSAGRIHIHTGDPCVGKTLAQQTFHLLRAEAALTQSLSAATNARELKGLDVLTIVTHELFRRAVIREADAAVGTHGHVAAGTALDERRVAAAIQQEDALFLFCQPVTERSLERLAHGKSERDVCRGRWSRRRPLHAQIDDAYLWQRRTACTVGEREQLVLPRRRIRPALQTWRRTAEHHHRARSPRPYDGNLARMISRRFALLVARLVLLVHDDRAEISQRSKDGGACADRDALFSAREGEPGVATLTRRQVAVQHGDAVAELGAEAIHRLGRECDLRHEHDGRAILLDDDATEQLQIDQRLAAPGDAV